MRAMPSAPSTWKWNFGISRLATAGHIISRLTRKWNRSGSSVITKRRHDIRLSGSRGWKQIVDPMPGTISLQRRRVTEKQTGTQENKGVHTLCLSGANQVHPIGSGGGAYGGAIGARCTGGGAGCNCACNAGNRSAKKYKAYAGKNTATGTFTNAITQSMRTITTVPATIAAVIVSGFQASPAPFAAITSTTITIPTGRITNKAAMVDKIVKRT